MCATNQVSATATLKDDSLCEEEDSKRANQGITVNLTPRAAVPLRQVNSRVVYSHVLPTCSPWATAAVKVRAMVAAAVVTRDLVAHLPSLSGVPTVITDAPIPELSLQQWPRRLGKGPCVRFPSALLTGRVTPMSRATRLTMTALTNRPQPPHTGALTIRLGAPTNRHHKSINDQRLQTTITGASNEKIKVGWAFTDQ